MRQEPLFSKGQKVVCANRLNEKGECNDNLDNDLIEGKTYTVNDPEAVKRGGRIWIDVKESKFFQLQTQFIPLDFDRHVEEESHQALKGIAELKG